MSKRKSKSSKLEAEVARELGGGRPALERILEIITNEGHTLTPAMVSSLQGRFTSMGGSIDIGYIKTVVFPEDNFFDIPQPLSTISFSRFSHKDETIISTGNGSGMMLWFPRCTSGPCLFLYLPSAVTTNISMPTPSSTRVTLPASGAAPNTPVKSTSLLAGFAYDY